MNRQDVRNLIKGVKVTQSAYEEWVQSQMQEGYGVPTRKECFQWGANQMLKLIEDRIDLADNPGKLQAPELDRKE